MNLTSKEKSSSSQSLKNFQFMVFFDPLYLYHSRCYVIKKSSVIITAYRYFKLQKSIKFALLLQKLTIIIQYLRKK